MMLNKIIFTIFISILIFGFNGCGTPSPNVYTKDTTWLDIQKNINNYPESDQIKIVKNDTKFQYFKYIKNPSEAVQIAAVSSLYTAQNIKYIKNPSNLVQETAVKNNPKAIQYIKNPSQKIKKIAILHGASCYLKNPSQDLVIYSILNTHFCPRWNLIKNPTEPIILAALKSRPESFILDAYKTQSYRFFKKPSLDIQMKYFNINDKSKLKELEFQEANKYHKIKKYKKAFFWYTLSAENDYDGAYYMLGEYYSLAHAISRDYLKAAYYYKKAVNDRFSIIGAKYNECYMYYKAKSYTKAISCFQESNTPESTNMIALMYENGNGVDMNKTKAYKLYLKAAKRANKNAQLNLDRLCKNSSWACK